MFNEISHVYGINLNSIQPVFQTGEAMQLQVMIFFFFFNDQLVCVEGRRLGLAK